MGLSYANCLGASNIMNVNLKHFQNAKLYPELEGAYTLKNDKYKVSLIYWNKIILVTSTSYKQFDTNKKYIKP